MERTELTAQHPNATPDRSQSMDEFQATLTANHQRAVAMHDAIIAVVQQRTAAADVADPTHQRRFTNDFSQALIRRADAMRRNLDMAQQNQADAADAPRLACLEQANNNWKWFNWTLAHQSYAPQSANATCTTCRLNRLDQNASTCPSCYDIEISTSLLVQ